MVHPGLFEADMITHVLKAPWRAGEIPTAIANFPKEFIPFPPRSFVERAINVVRWTDFAEGGHFPALERPDELRADIQAFARDLRRRGL